MPCKCCDCVNVGNWQIKGSGGGTSDTNVVIGNGTLNNLTAKWTPLWYTSLGPTTYNLVVTCDKKEEIIDTWTSTIVLCATEDDRYPEHTISLATTLPDPCKSCGLSFGGETIPLNKVGYTFTGSVDGEWSNQLNWRDVDGDTPSGTLPGKTGPFDDDIVIKGDVLSCSLTTMPQVDQLTTDGGNIGISLSAVNATISGFSKVLLDGDCATGGVLYVTDPASFIDSSENEGSVIGDAVFNQSARLRGYVSGNVELRGTSVMLNTALTHASCGGNVTAYDTATVVSSDIVGDVFIIGPSSSCFAKNCAIARDLFLSGGHTEGMIDVGEHVVATGGYFGGTGLIESAPNNTVLNYTASLTNCAISGPGFYLDQTVSTICGNVNLNNSQNYGVITGDAQFTDASQNYGPVYGDAAFYYGCNNWSTVEGNATFFAGTNNFGTIKQNATFSGYALNYNTVEGNATFSDQAFNLGGTINGNATFDGGVGNYENGVVGGTVAGDATFNDSNNATLSVVQGSATFNGAANNFGTVSQNAVFNGTSTNQGTVTGTATFNGTSTNQGTVTGTATFNNDSNNYGINGTTVCNTTGNCP